MKIKGVLFTSLFSYVCSNPMLEQRIKVLEEELAEKKKEMLELEDEAKIFKSLEKGLVIEKERLEEKFHNERRIHTTELNVLTDRNERLAEKYEKLNKKMGGIWGKTQGPIKFTVSMIAIFGSGYTIYYLFFKKHDSRTPTDIQEENFRKEMIKDSLEHSKATLELRKIELAKRQREEKERRDSQNEILELEDSQEAVSLNKKRRLEQNKAQG